MSSLAGVRSRWAAIGAACAVALGAGGFGVVNAVVSSGERSVFVPVSPIRVLDTRDSTEIANGTRRLVVEGQITLADGSSSVVVPSAASAVAINVTATSTRKNGAYGFVTVFPCVSDGDGVPNASSLNFETGVDIANALSVSTSANGSICMYVYGTADLIVDVAGYYVDHDHDDRYYTEAEVDAALAAKASSRDWLPIPAGSTPVTVDATGNTGYDTSIAIGVNGFPVISYYDGTNGDLRVAACADITCSTATTTTVDATGVTGEEPSIAIGVNGFPVISYYDVTNADLRVAACADVACTSATKTTVDATGTTGQYTSIAIGINGFPVISYYDVANSDLRVAACADVTCSVYPATTTTLDSAGIVGWETSIAFGSNGYPFISYYDFTNGDLKVATCLSWSCGSATKTTVDTTGFSGRDTSIAIGANGFPVISYYESSNGVLRVAVPWWVVGGR